MNKTVSNKKLICMNLNFYAMKNVLIYNNKAVIISVVQTPIF